MADRQYGIQPGYDQQPTRRTRRPMSFEEPFYATEPTQLHDYPPSSLQPGVRSPPRRPVAPYDYQPSGKPVPPPHREPTHATGYRESTTTPDQDAYGAVAAGGGMTGVAAGVADNNPRYSAADPFQDDVYAQRTPDFEAQSYYSQASSNHQRGHVPPAAMGGFYDAGGPPGRAHYQGDGYDEFDPRDIADDGDDGVGEYRSQRKSRFGRSAAAGAGAAGAAGVLSARDASGHYGPVPGGQSGTGAEKSEWLQKQSRGSKKMRWVVGLIIAFVVIAAVAGTVAGVLLTRNSGGGGGGDGDSSSAPSMDDIDGYLDSKSPQVQAVLNNKDLHKVFPAMDYSPLKTQYPDCILDPPDQNNVTLDVAVLSQLTPAVRLYGTDCNQTEMVLEAIKRLELADSMHIWLGVYLDGNSTTNNRQINQMWDIIDNYDAKHFTGVIVGNEVLFSKYMSITKLGDYVSTFRTKVSSKGINIPVSTADLGIAWTAGLAADSDIVMANVHAFFAGVTPEQGPGWTWSFWTGMDTYTSGSNSSGNYPKQIIAETGWPSEGGNNCGTGKKCPTPTEGSVASTENLNIFLDGWVCESLKNGTTYFYFEAFDEPWKVKFNDPEVGDFWEPHWGLLDVNRKLKKDVIIPDCGGQTIDEPYEGFYNRRRW